MTVEPQHWQLAADEDFLLGPSELLALSRADALSVRVDRQRFCIGCLSIYAASCPCGRTTRPATFPHRFLAGALLPCAAVIRATLFCLKGGGISIGGNHINAGAFGKPLARKLIDIDNQTLEIDRILRQNLQAMRPNLLDDAGYQLMP